MAEGRMYLSVITPEGSVVQNVECTAAVLPVVDGSMGILPRHAPMVAALRAGVVKYKDGGRYQPLAVAGGFAEVSNDRITVLVDAAEPADRIDVLRARQARERAEARLKHMTSEVDAARARAALERALARLRAARVAGRDKD